MVDVVKESVNDIRHGHVTVGTSRVQLSSVVVPSIYKGVTLRAPGSADTAANTDPIWVGGSGVTANSAATTGGLPICPGESLFIPTAKLDGLWLISTGASQDLAWLAM